ncbi:hypothetical protein [Paraburkholderia graminis]|uniref:hypothetical protein n=1 Tax=Paraburkholderia graminis TaxID=60548 RepID=UPI001E4DC1BA|nr:hypothetical protein [Paraburkholderia graminis]
MQGLAVHRCHIHRCVALIAVFFRTYWAITLAPALLLYFGPAVLRKPLSLAFVAVVLFACVAVNFRIQYGETLDFARQMVNESRYPNEVGSLIVQIIPGGNIVSDVTNAMLILGTFLLPLPLILSGVATQTIGGICTFFTLALMFSRYQGRRAVAAPDRFGSCASVLSSAFLRPRRSSNPTMDRFSATYRRSHRLCSICCFHRVRSGSRKRLAPL